LAAPRRAAWGGAASGRGTAGDNVGMGAADAFDLDRFVAAQDAGGTYARAVAELSRGAKTTHWMWFVFPQVAGLGHSPAARQYAISSVAEARAYLAHPVLGPRLTECARLLTGQADRTAEEILGGIDAVKLRSSMTLFLLADPDQPVFRQVLDQFYGGAPDEATERICGSGPGRGQLT
jgi:uncharacterized protein (DUF1810 family)